MWISSNGGPIFDEHGEFQGYRGIARDVTTQVEVERALRKSDARFPQLFETASDWYSESDAKSS